MLGLDQGIQEDLLDLKIQDYTLVIHREKEPLLVVQGHQEIQGGGNYFLMI